MHQQFDLTNITTNAKRSARWTRAIVFLALFIGGLSQALPSLAAPAAAEMRYSMLARKLNGNTTICVGDDVPIHVRVMRAEFVGNEGSNVQDIPGAHVEASMSNPGIGRLNPITMNTGWNRNDPGGADFKFHAEKPGSTTITFKGTISRIWWQAKLGLYPLVDRRDFVEAQVEITVEQCQYKVTTISKWLVTGPADLKIEAWINEAGLTDDGTGHFKGVAKVSWSLAAGQVEDCQAQSLSGSSEAELNAELDEDHLIVDVSFLPANVSLPVFCVGSDGGIVNERDPVQMTPSPVTPTVSASGGGKRLPHVLRGPESVAGSVVVIVTRLNQP